MDRDRDRHSQRVDGHEKMKAERINTVTSQRMPKTAGDYQEPGEVRRILPYTPEKARLTHMMISDFLSPEPQENASLLF